MEDPTAPSGRTQTLQVPHGIYGGDAGKDLCSWTVARKERLLASSIRLPLGPRVGG